MGLDDKIENQTQDLRGKVKEGVGNATGDEALERQGQNDQGVSKLKKAGESIKDGVKDLFDRDDKKD